jgi:hypothetical protein
MKSKLATTILALAATANFADEAEVAQLTQPSANLPLDLTTAQPKAVKKSFGYVRMGIADPDAINSVQALPDVGLGYRYGLPRSAVDVSVNYSRDAKVGSRETFSYSAPRVSYLRYVSNDAAVQSFYYGAGLAWSQISKGTAADFQGVDASLTGGYELSRTQNVHSFVQLDVTQPAVNVSTTTVSFRSAWQPTAAVSFGLGF